MLRASCGLLQRLHAARQREPFCGILRIGNVELGRAFYRLIQTVPSPGGGLQLIPEKFHNHYLLWESTNTFFAGALVSAFFVALRVFLCYRSESAFDLVHVMPGVARVLPWRIAAYNPCTMVQPGRWQDVDQRFDHGRSTHSDAPKSNCGSSNSSGNNSKATSWWGCSSK